jgi:hypothetical protein
MHQPSANRTLFPIGFVRQQAAQRFDDRMSSLGRPLAATQLVIPGIASIVELWAHE